MDFVGVYKISSIMDGNLLDVHMANFAHGTMIKSWPANENSAQTWKLEKEGVGYKMFTGGKSTCGALLMDEDYSCSRVQVCRVVCGKNQHWRIEQVPGQCDAFHIISSRTGKYLTNMGQGNQLTTTHKHGEHGHSNQWWKLQCV